MRMANWRAGLALALSLLAAGARAHEVVRLGNLPFAHFGAVAYIKDIAADCGIVVEEQLYPGASMVIAALGAGALDAGVSTVDAAIAGRAGGAPIFVVAGVARGGTSLLARPGHKLRSVQSLKGKRIGVARGGIEEVLLLALLQEGRADVTLVYLPAEQLNEALAQRRLDAIMQSAPLSSQAIAKGSAVEALAPLVAPVHTLLMSEAFYHRRRAVAEHFMRCFLEANRRFTDNASLAHEYVRHLVLRQRYSAAEVRLALASAPLTTAISEQHLQTMAEAMQHGGLLARAVPPREWMRTDLLDAARKDQKPPSIPR